jgi:DNA repair protein RecN (Recombination protein N)
MSANAGEATGRISRIASGGELSRIMLSLKNVLSESDGVGVAVFDEIDAGVSGVAAQRVGEKLFELARGRQVLCVTHLPQIAAMADAHFEITKSEHDGRTATHIKFLDDEGRALEISRLTGGENVTDITKQAAREQLAAAGAYKKAHSV